MSFCVEDPVVQWNKAILRKYQIQVLQRFCQEKTLLDIVMLYCCCGDIPYSTVSCTNTTVLLNVLKTHKKRSIDKAQEKVVTLIDGNKAVLIYTC